MAYKIPVKQVKQVSYKCDYGKGEQQKINHLLFTTHEDKDKYPKLLTIIIEKKKEPYFHFIKNETEFSVMGKWHDKKHKLYEEENAEIEVVYFDDIDETKSKALMSELNSYNKKCVKEKVLFSTITSLEDTSLKA
jgi:hypothetical protein